jgi:hypothetical protein
LKDRGKDAKSQFGFFVPALVIVFLVVLFVALLFGLRLLEKSLPIDIQYSKRYHELVEKEFLIEEERKELELEKCRFKRDLVVHIKKENLPNHENAKLAYDKSCQNILPR